MKTLEQQFEDQKPLLNSTVFGKAALEYAKSISDEPKIQILAVNGFLKGVDFALRQELSDLMI